LDENAPHGHVEGSRQAQNALAALARVEEEDKRLAAEKAKIAPPAQPEPAKAPKGRIELDFSDPHDVILRFAEGELLDAIQTAIDLKWRDDWWHLAAKDAPLVRQLAERAGYTVETLAPQSKRKEGHPQTLAGRGGRPDIPSAAAPAELLLTATIQHFVEKMTTGKAPKPYLSVLLKTETGDRWYSCFDRKYIEHLARGKGKQGEFFVAKVGEYWNIKSIKRIAGLEFEDGLPVVQNDREPGGSLF
jgi:hypothetical protein